MSQTKNFEFEIVLIDSVQNNDLQNIRNIVKAKFRNIRQSVELKQLNIRFLTKI